jgi:hypothetical protein
MSTTALAPSFGDSSDFDRIAGGYDTEQPDTPARTFRPTRAAERRDWRKEADAERGFPRHRTHEWRN